MSQFCINCKHSSKQYGTLYCELTRENYVDRVTGDRWSSASLCSSERGYQQTCHNFEQRPTLIQRLKEVFS